MSDSKIKVETIRTRILAQAGSFVRGEKGEQGVPGRDGLNGRDGIDGKDGKDGRDGVDGKDGVNGKDGRGILSISLSKTDGKDRTYTVTYTDGTTFEFTVRDGEDGKDGADGKPGMAGGAILKGAEKTSRKTNDYNVTSQENYPSSKALSDAIQQLRQEMSEIEALEVLVVETLPTTGETGKLYLVPSDDPQTSNVYDEYIWALQSDESHAWEKIGSTAVDLSGYVKSVNNTSPDANGNVALSIPTVNDATLTVTVNGTSVGTFTANASDDVTIPVTDTTYNNFVGTDGEEDGIAGLVPAPDTYHYSCVLKSDGTWGTIDYSEISNTPSIPTSADYWTVGTQGVSNYQTTYSKKTIYYTASGAQDNGLKVLSSSDTAPSSTTGAWSGRCLFGNEKRTFLLGTARNSASGSQSICGIGAHTWGSASSQTSAAWDNIYIQPDGSTGVYLGGYGWRGSSGWMRVQNNGNGSAAYRTEINTGTNSSPAWKKVLPNNATGTSSILFTPTVSTTHTYTYATSVNGTVTANYGTSYGYGSSAGSYATSLGYNAKATGSGSIQLGQGTNSTANTLYVGLSSSLNVQLLDSTGKVPDDRLNTTIARTSQIPTVNNSTITITQDGVTKGSFTLNQATGSTINLDAGGGGGGATDDWGQSLQGDVVTNSTFICAPYKCYSNERITSFSAPNVAGAVLYYCFANCTSLTSVSLPNLTTIGQSGLYRCFTSCYSLTSISLSNLTTIDNSGLAYCFAYCTSLPSISFPSLTTTSFGSYVNQFNNMISGISGCTIHFPSNLESTIQGLDGYPLFGGTNTVLAFDLASTS